MLASKSSISQSHTGKEYGDVSAKITWVVALLLCAKLRQILKMC